MSISIVLAKRQYHGRLKLGYRKIVTMAANGTDSDRKMAANTSQCRNQEGIVIPSKHESDHLDAKKYAGYYAKSLQANRNEETVLKGGGRG
jgi:hypothetical protein